MCRDNQIKKRAYDFILPLRMCILTFIGARLNKSRLLLSGYVNHHNILLKESSVLQMRELLIERSNKTMEIPENNLGRNDFLKNIFDSSENRISIELSPNSDFNTDLLVKLVPQFVSVTWLGTYLELPIHDIPAIILAKKLSSKGFPVLLHLAGRNLNKHRLLKILNELKDGGVKNILALQGDWPHVTEKDDKKCDFPYAIDLVSFIKENFGDEFCVGVAGYPDTHPHSQNIDNDIKFLQEKVSAGADFIITQASFNYEIFEIFAKTCREHQINVPILPGIFIIKSYKSLINMAKWCEFQIPKNILDFVEKNQDKKDIIENYGLGLAADLIKHILDSKGIFAGVHVFSMNDMDLVEKVMNKLENTGVAL